MTISKIESYRTEFFMYECIRYAIYILRHDNFAADFIYIYIRIWTSVFYVCIMLKKRYLIQSEFGRTFTHWDTSSFCVVCVCVLRFKFMDPKKARNDAHDIHSNKFEKRRHFYWFSSLHFLLSFAVPMNGIWFQNKNVINSWLNLHKFHKSYHTIGWKLLQNQYQCTRIRFSDVRFLFVRIELKQKRWFYSLIYNHNMLIKVC